ncbi:carboxypeptidase regulatory-like domain-containing protein, partial [Salmonella enterica]|nr:carboxypeptidase regulatory-like domain-containing protein [Salmonella enterica]HCM4642863.1 carboxypeptidase regulatory-like domain-containing protein [Salmonella enterica subsp. enterica serovar Panama]EJJ3988897.1 carboxypeptidase regulatory-like domain-containing protein [Salmonella enterica]EJJ4038659.1 carboxypeptidase regulatory-like domain-containing protein [Salmonella enterica]EJJ4053004.1 carboxypeptidase regulatory-like domain-containing protein [Salmonella enterica]
MTVLQGTLTSPPGEPLPATSLILTETDSKQTITLTTGADAHYYADVPPGTWRVSILPPGGTPEALCGVMAISDNTPDSTLDALMNHLLPSTLDITVLSYMRGLVGEAEKAAEAANSTVIKNITEMEKSASESADRAAKTLTEIQKVVSETGSIPGESAYDIWKSQQPAETDTSMTAYLAYQKGKDGAPGKDGDPG